ncbi:MAG: VOC family protein [Vicinamibacterales bacterium]
MKRTGVVLAGFVFFAALQWRSGTAAVEGRRAVPLQVGQVESVGLTVSDMDEALSFYTGTLPFVKVSERDAHDRPFELLTGLFGATARIVKLRLGNEFVELTEFLAPKGRPIPDDMRANDRVFQHVAIVVRDMDRAYTWLRAHHVRHASTAPQRLPEWNPAAGGIRAFYFRDPDGHFLEVISFPQGKGNPSWQTAAADASTGLFLGIDHTAIVVNDTEASLRFYRDVLGFEVAGESENYDVEQEHLNNVFGARLRITGLRVERGPGIELLEYLAPRDGKPAPADLRANDLGHWQTTLVTGGLQPLMGLAREHRVALVSPGAVVLDDSWSFKNGALTRDPDGHGMRLVTRPE